MPSKSGIRFGCWLMRFTLIKFLPIVETYFSGLDRVSSALPGGAVCRLPLVRMRDCVRSLATPPRRWSTRFGGSPHNTPPGRDFRNRRCRISRNSAGLLRGRLLSGILAV